MSDHDNKQTIICLYDALARRDGDAMGQLYHPDATFKDPVFGALSRSEVAQMWKMLCTRGKDLELKLVRAETSGDVGFAEWEAQYSYGKKRNKVHNRVRSEFVFREGLIVEQLDQFDIRKWTAMALGMPGRLFGWATLLHKTVQKGARRSLASFARQHDA